MWAWWVCVGKGRGVEFGVCGREVEVAVVLVLAVPVEPDDEDDEEECERMRAGLAVLVCACAVGISIVAGRGDAGARAVEDAVAVDVVSVEYTDPVDALDDVDGVRT